MKPFKQAYLEESQFAKAERQFRAAGMSEASIATQMKLMRKQVIWRNDEYQVNITPFSSPAGDMLHLSIKAVKKGVVRDWRVFQEIKNMLVGREHEAVELYPAESRKVDASNQYHLWAIAEPGARFPFGYGERLVENQAKNEGARQRPFTEGAL